MVIPMLPKLHCYVIDKDKAASGSFLIRMNPPKHRLHNSGERFDDVYNDLIGIWKSLGKGKEIDPFTPTDEEIERSKEMWKLKNSIKIHTQDAGRELIKQFKKIDKEKEKEVKSIKILKAKKEDKSYETTPKEQVLEGQDEGISKEDEEIPIPEIDLSHEPISVNGAGIDVDDNHIKDEIKNKDKFEDDIKELVEQENKVQMKEDNKIKIKKLKEEDIDDFDADFAKGLNED